MIEAAHSQPGSLAGSGARTRSEHGGPAGAEEGGPSVVVLENLAKLSMSEVGQHLTPAYLTVIDAEPRFEATLLIPYEGDDIPELVDAGAAARPPHRSESARPEVAIETGGWRAWDRLLRQRRAGIPEIARALGMEPEDIGPREYVRFALLHEFGHVRNYIDKDFDPEMIDDEREAGLNTLPAPGVMPSQLSKWGREHPIKAWLYARGNRHRLGDMGVHSFKDLLAAQEVAYRHIPDEAYADRYAADIFRQVRVLS